MTKTPRGAKWRHEVKWDGYQALFEQQPVTRANNNEARALYEKALEIDPNNVDALEGDASTYLHDYLFGWRSPEIDYQTKILGQAERAITLAPGFVWPYFSKSEYLHFAHRPDEAIGVADAGLAIDPNFAPLYAVRATAETSLGHFEQARSDILQAMRLSPRDVFMGAFHVGLGDAELGLGHFDAAINAYHKSIDLGYNAFIPYVDLAAAYALEGKTEEAETALAEARRLNPQLTVKWLIDHAPTLPPLFEGLRKAGLPEQ